MPHLVDAGETTPRVGLVSGANRGLGKEIARQLALRGVLVLLGYRDQVLGVEAATELRLAGCSVSPLRLDVTELDSVAAAASVVQRDYGRLDILVNNAGIRIQTPTIRTTSAEMAETFSVNVFGVANAVSTFLPLLSRSATPRIVNVSSRMGSLGLASAGTAFDSDIDQLLAYSASKAALNMLTIRYAQAFSRAPSMRHIKINSVTPGYVATGMTRNQGGRTTESGARIVVALAELPEDGPTGGFFNEEGTVPW